MGVEGCVACDLTDGRVPLPGGLIHATEHWLVEHCIGPLGVGTLVVKPLRHVLHVADLAPAEAAELGPLLQRVSAVVTDLSAPEQVYVCLWSHGPCHIHFVVQPVDAELMAIFDAHGPLLQQRMFEHGAAPDPVDVEAHAERARALLGA